MFKLALSGMYSDHLQKWRGQNLKKAVASALLARGMKVNSKEMGFMINPSQECERFKIVFCLQHMFRQHKQSLFSLLSHFLFQNVLVSL